MLGQRCPLPNGGCHQPLMARATGAEALPPCYGGECQREVGARLHDGDADAARVAFEEFDQRLEVQARMEARFLLWRATSDPTDLAEAHRLLQHLRDHAPEEYRDTMVENVPPHRDIAAAWAEHGAE